MAWTTPKTNWSNGDFYNIEDWQRMRDNAEYLCDACNAVNGTNIESKLPWKELNDILYYEDMNDLYSAVMKVASVYEKDYRFNFTANMSMLGAEELNRFESLELELYNYMKSQLSMLPRLAVVLGRKHIGNRIQ